MHRRMLALVVLSALSAFTGSALAAPNCTTRCVYVPLITVPPPDVVIVGPGFIYTYPGGALLVVGQIRNTRAEPVRLSTVNVHVMDSHGHVVATDMSVEHLKVLPANTTTCFAANLPAPPTGGSIQIDRVDSTPAPGAVPRLTVVDTNGLYAPAQRFYFIVGDVRNDDTVHIAFSSVVATLYNAAGTPIGCAIGDVNEVDLAPGAVSSVHAVAFGTQYSDVVRYTLQTDGTRR